MYSALADDINLFGSVFLASNYNSRYNSYNRRYNSYGSRQCSHNSLYDSYATAIGSLGPGYATAIGGLGPAAPHLCACMSLCVCTCMCTHVWMVLLADDGKPQIVLQVRSALGKDGYFIVGDESLDFNVSTNHWRTYPAPCGCTPAPCGWARAGGRTGGSAGRWAGVRAGRRAGGHVGGRASGRPCRQDG